MLSLYKLPALFGAYLLVVYTVRSADWKVQGLFVASASKTLSRISRA
jgi:hypothetical protein